MNRTRMVLATAAAGVTAVALTACGNSTSNEGASASPNSVQTSSVAPAAAQNQADMMFTRHMIPHHQQAIEMSDMILAKPGIDPRVVDLANQIKAAQGPEIEQMQGWLDQWGMPRDGGMAGDMPHHGDMNHGPMMPGMAGMMSPEDMQALESAQGVEASKLYLTQMIAHHEGAITMAQDEIDNGQFPDTVALAESIVVSQQQEIDTMKQLLNSL